MVSGWFRRLFSWRPHKVTTLTAKAWRVGILLVGGQLFLAFSMMLFPPNGITVPLFFLFCIGAFASIILVIEAHERCRRQCRGTWW